MNLNLLDNFYEDIITILHQYKELPKSVFSLTATKGGMSREIYKLDVNGDSYILRILKNNPFYKLEDEHFHFENLSKNGLAPILFGKSNNIRIEEYLNCRVIKAEELTQNKQFFHQVAYNLGKIHSLNIEKKGTFLEILSEDLLKSFKDKCENEENPKDKEFVCIAVKLIEDLDFIKSVTKDDKLVLSHNDIWVGNIVIVDDIKAMLIDYELMNYNFQGYDIGKLILETMFVRDESGIRYKIVKELYPSKEDIYQFLKEYLSAFQDSYNDDELDNLYIELHKGILVACYFWTIMGIILGRGFSKEMDFMKFAIDHYDLYLKYKKEYLSLKNNSNL